MWRFGMVLSVVLILVVVAATVGHSAGCYIINCPRGGKRALENRSGPAARECPRCGPSLSGQCIGPTTCCSPQAGCTRSLRVALECSMENLVPVPCRLSGPSCTLPGQQTGTCVGEGMCCMDGEKCSLSPECSMRTAEDEEARRQERRSVLPNWVLPGNTPPDIQKWW
ncbi:vasopressin-neurophysin 2-like [Branchiostoma floridae]|uniref:Vasopressin-neurophysin 2-like n=1 Tax=Branchiostoma floridae TaxID=7739 RepID=C3Y3Y0_BRAFL|nr:vasopressin-neurophysin 2-like [Branchiostoma floridae]|eukprot:XP_002608996.1 vasopressin-neurophysin protein [Branchiostoma floridae]